MASSELVWQLIRGNNSFLKKGLNNTFFSAEPGNLTSKHSYKFSGIANSANVDLTTDKDNAIVLKKGKSSFKSKKGRSKKAITVFKKDSRRVMKGVTKEVSGYRSDLADVAIKRVSALAKSARVIKAASK